MFVWIFYARLARCYISAHPGKVSITQITAEFCVGLLFFKIVLFLNCEFMIVMIYTDLASCTCTVHYYKLQRGNFGLRLKLWKKTLKIVGKKGLWIFHHHFLPSDTKMYWLKQTMLHVWQCLQYLKKPELL